MDGNTRYLVYMSMEFNDCTAMSLSTVVVADNEEGAKDIARDQLQALVVDGATIIVDRAVCCEYDEYA